MVDYKMTELIQLNQLCQGDFQCSSNALFKILKSKWIIKKFSKLAIDKELVSPDFEPLPKCYCNFILCKMHQKYTLCLENKSDNDLELECAVSITNSMEKTLLHRTLTGILSNQRLDVFDVSHIVEEYKNSENDTLTIACEFKIFEFFITQDNCIQVNHSLTVYNGFKKLSLDLKNMYMKQKTDVTLVAIGGQMQAHKWLLSARSPIFEKILYSRMDVNKHVTINTHMNLPILKRLVDFLYCGEVSAETDIEQIGFLYSAADKFEVFDLRQMCADSLMSQLTVDSATQILILSSRAKNSCLKIKVQDFIAKNFDRVTDTDAWDHFVSHATELATETIKCYVKQIKLNGNTFTVSN